MLRQKGARAFKIMGDAESFQEVGIPDLLVCYRGRFLGLEAKMPGNTPTTKQLVVLDEIVSAGGYGAVFTTVEQVSRILAIIDREVELGSHSRSRFYRYDLSGDTRHSKRKQ